MTLNIKKTKVLYVGKEEQALKGIKISGKFQYIKVSIILFIFYYFCVELFSQKIGKQIKKYLTD